MTYPSGLAIQYLYTATQGYLADIQKADGSVVYWQALAMNAEGHITEGDRGTTPRIK